MPLTPSATRDLLAQLGHRPRHFLGQNFLVDGNIVRKSLALADVRQGDAIVEVGPGLGTLTSALLEAGAEVWAVEKDPGLHAHLAATLLPQYPDTLHLLEGDAVEHPLAGLEGAGPLLPDSAPDALGGRPCEVPLCGTNERRPERASGAESGSRGPAPSFKVVANLPYAIATPWLDAVLTGPLPERMVLMLQQEAAQRYAAPPGGKSFGAISIFLQTAYDVGIGHKVSAACFYPKPDVGSCLLTLTRKPAPIVFSRDARILIRACFQKRRKQIGPLIRGLLGGNEAIWLEHLGAEGFSPQTRPEAIPVGLWIKLASHISSVA